MLQTYTSTWIPNQKKWRENINVHHINMKLCLIFFWCIKLHDDGSRQQKNVVL